MVQDIRNDLKTLAGLLQNFWKRNINNERILYGIVQKNTHNNTWSYSFGGAEEDEISGDSIVFRNISFGGHARPEGINEYNSEFSVTLGARIIGKTNSDEFSDVFKSLNVNIKVSGYYYPDLDKDEKKDVICSWHLDGGEEKKDEEGKKIEPLFTHPKYHMNFGGSTMTKPKNLEGSTWDFGDALLLETPRLVHHPMDVVLAVDFILKNFYTIEEHSEITEEMTYKELLRSATQRFLKPYYLGIANQWTNERDETKTDFVPSELNPSLDY